MLPWIFAVLVLLNLGLFLWGHQREMAREPAPTPVPEAPYEIRLTSESEPVPDAETSALVH